MERSYWEKIAPAYDDEIFDVLRNDKKALIVSAIRGFADKKKTVLDAGCAVGKWLPVLSPLFKKVYAADISAKNLSIAEKRYEQLDNIEYKRVDFSSPRAGIPGVDVVICINAILTDSPSKRRSFFKNISRALKKKGKLVLVVPSMESWLLSNIVQQEFNIDPATKKNNLSKSNRNWKKILEGSAPIDDVPTKHYLQEELALLLERVNFRVMDFRKIEYEWKTEFHRPPSWLKDPKPWDWLCVAEKV